MGGWVCVCVCVCVWVRREGAHSCVCVGGGFTALCVVLHCFVWRGIALPCPVLSSIALYCSALHCPLLSCPDILRWRFRSGRWIADCRHSPNDYLPSLVPQAKSGTAATGGATAGPAPVSATAATFVPTATAAATAPVPAPAPAPAPAAESASAPMAVDVAPAVSAE